MAKKAKQALGVEAKRAAGAALVGVLLGVPQWRLASGQRLPIASAAPDRPTPTFIPPKKRRGR
jgi:hypothetical protein